MWRWKVELIIEEDGEGYHGYCKFLKGLHTGGMTKHECLRNLGDAISAYMETIMATEPYRLNWDELGT